MKTILCMLVLVLYSLPLSAQLTSGGVQDGGHGSGGDEKADYTVAANPGWNLVSVPIVVGDYRPTAIFPTALTLAYAYQGGYVPEDTLDNGRGYWLKFGVEPGLFPERIADQLRYDTCGGRLEYHRLGFQSDRIVVGDAGGYRPAERLLCIRQRLSILRPPSNRERATG